MPLPLPRYTLWQRLYEEFPSSSPALPPSLSLSLSLLFSLSLRRSAYTTLSTTYSPNDAATCVHTDGTSCISTSALEGAACGDEGDERLSRDQNADGELTERRDVIVKPWWHSSFLINEKPSRRSFALPLSNFSGCLSRLLANCFVYLILVQSPLFSLSTWILI